MGFNFRKSIKIGPARVNLSKSGVGYSVGAKGFRYTKSPKKKKQQKSGLWQFLKGLFFLAMLIVLITFIVEHKTAFIILGIVAAILLVGYLFYVRKQLNPTKKEISPAVDDVSDSDT